jgi:hypothetical protein
LSKHKDTKATDIAKLVGVELYRRLGKRATYEYVPTTVRKWRVDLAFPTIKLAIEIDGRQHLRAAMQKRDHEKQNWLTEHGWKVLRFPAASVLTKKRLPRIVDQCERVILGLTDDHAACEVLTTVTERQ